MGRPGTTLVEKQIVQLHAGRVTQARIDELATKGNAGELTEAEEREYRAYVEVVELICILQAKARAILAGPPPT